MPQTVRSEGIFTPAARRAVKGLFVLLSVAFLAACGKVDSPPAAVAPPATAAFFECPVPEALRGKLAKVYFQGERVGEPPGKDVSSHEGVFSTNFIGLMAPDGTSTGIRLDVTMSFAAGSQALHAGCEGFRWKSLGDVTLFEYTYGSANPYPEQQLMYSRGPIPDFKNLRELFPAGDAFYEVGRGQKNCLAGLAKGDGEVERWCYADGKLEQTRKMFKVAHAEGEFRYTCDFSGDGPLMIEASILKPGAGRVPLGVEYTAAMADFADECLRAKVILEAKAIDEK